MDALEKLGWERTESESSVCYKHTRYLPLTEQNFVRIIFIDKDKNSVSIGNAHSLTKQELLALAEVVKEMENELL